MTNGFLQIPRSLLEHPTILSLNDLHYRIFTILLLRMCYAPCQQDDHGVIIDLEPGQYMFTLRKLASELGVDKGVLERLLIRLRDAKISRHETRHTKTILTFIYPELCKLLNKQTETENETKTRQDQDKIKTEKNKVIKQEDKESSSNAEIISIHEGWKHDDSLRPLCNALFEEFKETIYNNIHYQTFDVTEPGLSGLAFAAAAVSFFLGNKYGFDKSFLVTLRDSYHFELEKVVLSLYVLNTKKKKIENPEGLLVTICKTQNFHKLRNPTEPDDWESCDPELQKILAN